MEEDTCVICMSPLQETREFVFACTHGYHSRCIQEYLSAHCVMGIPSLKYKQMQCPLCRSPIASRLLMDCDDNVSVCTDTMAEAMMTWDIETWEYCMSEYRWSLDSFRRLLEPLSSSASDKWFADWILLEAQEQHAENSSAWSAFLEEGLWKSLHSGFALFDLWIDYGAQGILVTTLLRLPILWALWTRREDLKETWTRLCTFPECASCWCSWVRVATCLRSCLRSRQKHSLPATAEFSHQN